MTKLSHTPSNIAPLILELCTLTVLLMFNELIKLSSHLFNLCYIYSLRQHLIFSYVSKPNPNPRFVGPKPNWVKGVGGE